MKFKLYFFTAFLTLFFPPFTFAFFCPSNFSQISEGMTTDQVDQICGKPLKEEKRIEKPQGPQEWSYFVPQTVATNALTQVQGTLKTNVVFDANGQAINISVNGIGVGSTAVCGKSIQLGDTVDTVKNVCGKPNMINKQEGSPDIASGNPPPINVTDYYYTTSSGKVVKLNFENGILKGEQE